MPRVKPKTITVHLEGDINNNSWKVIIDNRDIYDEYTKESAYMLAYNLTVRFQEKGFKVICTKNVTNI